MPSLDTKRLETFVLARLLVRPPSGLGMTDVRRQLFPFVSQTLSESAWRAALTETVERLRGAKLVDDAKLCLTNEGQKEALLRLSLSEHPGHTKWPKFLAEAVIPAALGVASEQVSVKTADDLVALVLAQHFQVKLTGKLSLARVLNALVWKALECEADDRLTAGALQRAVLRRHLEGATRMKEPESLARILAGKVSGARSAGAQQARQAILRDWLVGRARVSPAKASPEQADTMRIETFATAALKAARDPHTIRFGSHKAFIDSVFERYQSGSAGPLMELPMFKKKLVAAHRKGLLTLARADLVEAMDPKRVAASETSYLNTTFHFVEAD